MATVALYGFEVTANDDQVIIDCIDESSLSVLQQYLPTGVAWSRDADATITETVRALSYEFTRINKRTTDFFNELDPRTTIEMLPDFERVYGLPDECAQPVTIAGRRAALQSKMIGFGSPSIPNIIASAEAVNGQTVGVVENFRRGDLFTCDSNCDAALYGSNWLFYWSVYTQSTAFDAELACLIEDNAPDHTIVDIKHGSIASFVGKAAVLTNTWSSICYASDLQRHCAVSSDGAYQTMISDDGGATWAVNVAAESAAWSAVARSPKLKLFCAVNTSSSGNVMTSTDGISWNLHSIGLAISLNSICWADNLGLFVAVGNSGTVIYSKDGVVWFAANASSNANWKSISWSAERNVLCAVSTSSTNQVMTSVDALTWVARTTPIAAAFDFASITRSETRDVFCAMLTDLTDSITYFMTSSDGVTWVQTSTIGLFPESIVWSTSQQAFIAVGIHTDPSLVCIVTSLDAITWTDQSISAVAPGQGLNSVCDDSDRCIVVAVGNSMVASSTYV